MRGQVLVVLASLLLAGCNGAGGPDLVANPTEPCGALDTAFQPDDAYNPRVRLDTSRGVVELVIYANQVPSMAANFLSLANDGEYNDTRFHRLDPDVLIHGGDPLSSSSQRHLWGTGSGGIELPHSFHQFLRHDEPGTVSFFNARPNTVGSQFVIHLQERPDLDDRYPVFAKVTKGLDAVRNISQTPTDERDRPQFDARLERVRLLEPIRDPAEATVSLSAVGYDCTQAAEPGGTAEFLLAVRNTGQRLLNGTMDAQMPDGWGVDLRNADRIVVPSGQTVAYAVNVSVPADTAMDTSHDISLWFNDTRSSATTSLGLTVNVGTLGPAIQEGDEVHATYVGVLEDGRPFDTTIETYTEMSSLTWFKQPVGHFEPIPFTVGSDRLIEGFQDGVARAKVGQSIIESVPPDEGYGNDAFGESQLGGRLLFFQIQVVEGPQGSG